MSDLLTHVERSLMVDVDLDKEPQCESPGHASIPWNHGGPGEIALICPCGLNGLICRTFRQAFAGHETYWCRFAKRHPVTAVRFIEL